MKKKTLISVLLILFILLSIYFVEAPNGEEVDWGNVGEMDDATFESNFAEDPANGFKADSTRAWLLIEATPGYMFEDPKRLIDLTLKDDKGRTMELINRETALLTDPDIFNRFDQEVRCEPQKCNLFKDYPKAGAELFRLKGEVTNEGAKVNFYDGTNIHIIANDEHISKLNSQVARLKAKIRTALRRERWRLGNELKGKLAELKTAKEGNNFNIGHFPGAIVKEDGSLVTKKGYIFSGTSSLYVENERVHMEGGEAEYVIGLEEGPKTDFSVKQGKVKLVVLGSETIYEGSFDFRKDEEGYHISSVDKEGFVRNIKGRKATINGQIIDFPLRVDMGGFVLIGNAEVKFNDHTWLSIKSEKKVYYSEKDKGFCKEGHSCVINTGEDFYRQTLRFESVENKDEITFKSNIYHGAVEVNDVKEGGKVVYITMGKKQKEGLYEKNRIIVESEGKINTGKNLKNIRVGSFDVFFSKEDKQMRSHYSSTAYMSMFGFRGSEVEGTGAYIERVRKGNSFAACERGSCEKVFAENFGKVIKPKGGGEPKTTIILSGDNADTAKAMKKYCGQYGCYILNNRDLPEKTNSKNIVITGHHTGGERQVWRLSESKLERNNGIGFDALSFSDLPKGQEVEAITFSSCSTVRWKDPEIINPLIEAFENLEIVQGYQGTAPGNDPLEKPIEPGDRLRPFREDKGMRTWFVKKGDPVQWYWTNGRGYWKEVALK